MALHLMRIIKSVSFLVHDGGVKSAVGRKSQPQSGDERVAVKGVSSPRTKEILKEKEAMR